MEWVVLPTILQIFRSLFIEEFQFLQWARQAVLVLAMGSSSSLNSCDEAQLRGWTRNELSSAWSVVWPLVGADWGEVYSYPPFLS